MLRILVASLVAILTAAGLAAPASGNSAGTALVINEVYGGGGSTSTSALFKRDWVELYNPTGTPLSTNGLFLHYRSASGTSSASVVALPNETVPAHGHYLVVVSPDGAFGGAAVTGADHEVTTMTMAGSNGQVALASTSASITHTGTSMQTAPGIVDFVGYGTAASSETAPTGTALSVATSAARKAAGVDSDSNAADFSVLTSPTPTGSGTSGEPGEEEPVETVAIADIQGTGFSSPLAGDTVTTEGVITALYPTGGFNGFYLQTGGTGGSTDATPGASDGIFVFGPNVDESALALGDSVSVTGRVSEFNGLTEITPAAGGVKAADTALDPVTAAPLAWGALDTNAEKEAHEGELLAPTGDFTVTNTYITNRFAEVGLAAGDRPLIQPTDVEDAQTGDIVGVINDNESRKILLDDGSSRDFFRSTSQGEPLPWLGSGVPPRVGAAVTFTGDVIIDWRFNEWRFQPTSALVGDATDGAGTATFENTRTAAPGSVGGDLKLATFNVLNYFPTTGEDYVAAGGTCTYYTDRAGTPIAVNRCSGEGPRGAATQVSFERQQAKIVKAINAMDASVVSLEELENSIKFGPDRDAAIAQLVTALNNDLGSEEWAYVPSPATVPESEDVIRLGFIYKSGDVAPIGESRILDDPAFDNARDPLAQVFKPVGTKKAGGFIAIANHFKSKGSGTDDGTGQGLANPDRIAQAQALSAFAKDMSADTKVPAVFLLGDFNSYTMEDPMQVLEGEGFAGVESTVDPGEMSYSFSGLSGSLDHVLANEAAMALVTGADIWNINAEEAVAFQYSRFNYNVLDLFDPATPYASSDHNPEIVGILAPPPGESGKPRR